MASFGIRWNTEPIADLTIKDEFKDDLAYLYTARDKLAVWNRGNGSSILMIEMHDEHIINALRKLKRTLSPDINRLNDIYYPFLLAEAVHRNLMEKEVGEWDAEENKK